MASNTQGQLHVVSVSRQTKSWANSSLSYVVKRDVLSIQISLAASPRLVFIPENSLVELIGLSSQAGMVELIWEHRSHRIFEADLTRLKPDRRGNRSVPRLIA
jgi:hypothetical protein